jgi:hypothetical protein
VNSLLHLVAAFLTYYMVFVFKDASEIGKLSAPLFASIGFLPTELIEFVGEALIFVVVFYLVRFIAASKGTKSKVLYLFIMLSFFSGFYWINFNDALSDLILYIHVT